MLVLFMRASRGWALSRTGDVDLAIAEIETAAELAAQTGARIPQNVFPAFLADTHQWARRPDEADPPAALTSLQRAVDLAESQGSVTLGDQARESLAQLG